MRRRLFAGGSVLSLLLCLATAALWVRSYWRSDDAAFVRFAEGSGRKGTVHVIRVATDRGGLGIIHQIWPQTHEDFSRIFHQARSSNHSCAYDSSPAKAYPASGDDQKLGFAWNSRDDGIGGEPFVDSEFVCPMWLPGILFAVLPAIALIILLRHRRRRKEGSCLACHYDLTGNVSGVCPECGIPVRQNTRP